MINLLIILPENEKEDDESFQICTKIREKFTLLDFQILLIVNKYRSYIIKRNHDLQINDFLIRPFDVSALLTRIKMLYDYQNLYLQNQELLKSEKEKFKTELQKFKGFWYKLIKHFQSKKYILSATFH